MTEEVRGREEGGGLQASYWRVAVVRGFMP